MAPTATEKALRAHIASLEREVEFLRGLVAPPVQAIQLPAMEAGKLWTSEDEDEARELHEAGLIDDDELASMLDAAGALSTDIDFAPTS